MLASWGGAAREVEIDLTVDVACWDLNTLQVLPEEQVQSVLSGFFTAVIRDNAFWLTTMEVSCLDTPSLELLVASRAQLAQHLNVSTRGGIRALIINESQPLEKAIDE